MLVIISYIFTFLHLTYFGLCIIMMLQEKRGTGVLQKTSAYGINVKIPFNK